MDDHIADAITVYDSIADQYNEKIDSYAPRPEREKFISLIKPGGHILDAGCGPGRDADYFAQKKFTVTGVDLSEKLLNLARRRTKEATFIQQDLRSLQFPDNSFDGIWACASLLHLRRTEVPGVLRRFRDVLKSSGTLFVLLKEGSGEADVQDRLSPELSRHFVYYKPPELKSLLTDAGFRVDEMYVWNEEKLYPGRRDITWISGFSTKR